MALSIQCPSCSLEIPANNRFCSSCGHAFVSASQVPTGMAGAAPQAQRISSTSVPVGGFTPGAILADRYRIIGLLGRGGMGEVYRADDLKLGQPVALKFLPRELAIDPVRRERFFAEVRITRQLAHPNICRVYDIAEFDGQHFLSMEYIDGEDLASLIKRIGYLPNEKALDVAKQLALGLSAAHDKGVLHRDLKPANIMIDGRGRVRITDFGLAVASADEEETVQMFGTPAYMAPEQFAGKGASVRSDIYALGLVLYEVYCGRKVFTASTLAELREQKDGPTPSAPSQIREGIDPIVDRVIMRCLERDPRSRPASAAHLAAALPGGDPLAAALDAGETPSPEMVAASGLKEGVRPAIAAILLGVVIAGALAIVALNPRTMLYLRSGLEKPPEVLADRAREILKNFGHTTPPADSAFGFSMDASTLRYATATDQRAHRWDRIPAYTPVFFWYRQSSQPMARTTFAPPPGIYLTSEDPPLLYFGDALVVLNGRGQLRSLRVNPGPEPEPKTRSTPGWNNLLVEAGFDPATLTAIEPRIVPRVYADELIAWQGSLPDDPGTQVEIEAAAFAGRPVSFEITGPWTSKGQVSAFLLSNVAGVLGVLLLFTLVAGGVFFARRNLRLGRGDRRGAARLAFLIFGLLSVEWLLNEHHVSSFVQLQLTLMFLGFSLFGVGLTWVLYIALEPFVRRRWPQILISWTRLLAGDWRDPLVGRDVLLGCAAGMITGLLSRVGVLSPAWMGKPEMFPLFGLATPFEGTNTFIGGLAVGFIGGIFTALAFLFLVFLLRIAVRNDLAALVIAMLVSSFGPAPEVAVVDQVPWIASLFLAMANAVRLAVLFRFGLVALVTTLIVHNTLLWFPSTFDTSVWLSPLGFAALGAVAAITLYGFRTALGSRRFFDGSGLEG